MQLVGQTEGLPQEASLRVNDSASDDPSAIYCPRCRDRRPRREWRRVMRRLASADDGKDAEVLRHQRCDEMVYSLIQSK